jgi:hypothetical protein
LIQPTRLTNRSIWSIREIEAGDLRLDGKPCRAFSCPSFSAGGQTNPLPEIGHVDRCNSRNARSAPAIFALQREIRLLISCCLQEQQAEILRRKISPMVRI